MFACIINWILCNPSYVGSRRHVYSCSCSFMNHLWNPIPRRSINYHITKIAKEKKWVRITAVQSAVNALNCLQKQWTLETAHYLNHETQNQRYFAGWYGKYYQ